MSASNWSGPISVTPGANAGSNLDIGPSLFGCGIMLGDARFPYRHGSQGPNALGWPMNGDMMVVDQVPSTLSVVAIAAAQVPVAATKLTLVSATGAGITVLAAATTIQPSGNVIPVGTLVIDGLPGLIAYGSNGTFQAYDPTKALARNIQIASAGNDSGATFTVAGYDIYGYPMTETITGASGATAVGKKAFKFVSSVTPAGTLSGSNVNVGQGDTFGFPLRVDSFGYASVTWNNASVAATSTGTFVFADTTSPATATTGDVRGTYLVASASNGTKRLQIAIAAPAVNLATTTGLTGVTQV